MFAIVYVFDASFYSVKKDDTLGLICNSEGPLVKCEVTLMCHLKRKREKESNNTK